MSEGSYKKLIVWQKSMDLVVLVFSIANKVPNSLQSGLADQMRRAAISIPSNIAEGKYRFSKNEGRHFFRIAYGSCAELETQLTLTKRLGVKPEIQIIEALDLCDQILRMLNVMLRWKANN
jgi:four helix bundle protein